MANTVLTFLYMPAKCLQVRNDIKKTQKKIVKTSHSLRNRAPMNRVAQVFNAFGNRDRLLKVDSVSLATNMSLEAHQEDKPIESNWARLNASRKKYLYHARLGLGLYHA